MAAPGADSVVVVVGRGARRQMIRSTQRAFSTVDRMSMDPALRLVPAQAIDIERLCALHNRSEAYDGVPRVLQVEELREELDDETIVLASDVRIAEFEGEAVGYVYTAHMPSDVRLEKCMVFGQVAPDWRGRGIGTALLTWGTERARQQLATSTNDLPKFIRVDTYAFIESACRLHARMGFVPERWFEELLRPLGDLPAQAEVGGIDVVDWPVASDGRDDEIRFVKNTAFADHWASSPTSAEQWAHHVRGFGARPDLSVVAVERDSGRIVGLSLNHRYVADDDLIGRRDGWVSTLATLAEWRGRGVASALIVASLHRFAAAGLTHASIGVDSDSPTGAGRLYRSLGFAPLMRSVASQIQVS